MGRRKKIVENLKVHGIADKGMSVARDENGMVYFVKAAVPGDIIDLLVLRKKKGFQQGIVHQFRKYSEDRVTAFCDHFGQCGGCKWQNLLYHKQLEHKQTVVKDAMTRIAKLDESIIKEILACKRNQYYRNKLEYSFSTKRWLTDEEIKSDAKNLQSPALGFHAPGTFDKVVDVNKCFLQDDLSNEIRNFIRTYAIKHELSYFDIKEKHGVFRNMVVRNSNTGEWMVNLIFGTPDLKTIKKTCEDLRLHFPQITALFYTINTKANDSIYDLDVIRYHGKDHIIEQISDINYRIGPKSFFQTNSDQTKVLFDKVVQMASLGGDETIYDLYTGTGSIALYLAGHCKSIVGIETVKEAIEDAKKNAKLNNIENATFLVGDVKDVLTTNFHQKHGKADVIITDPPRAGMHKNVVATLLHLAAPKIIYVSCNPATQARDLQLLSEQYETTSIQPVDMFPHTSHVESIAMLSLKS